MCDRRQDILDRIIANCVEDPETGCLEWQGATSGDGRGGGYPRMKLDGRTVAVHRVLAVHHFGFLHTGRQIDHMCRNRRCLNIEHLEIVTAKENCRRRDSK